MQIDKQKLFDEWQDEWIERFCKFGIVFFLILGLILDPRTWGFDLKFNFGFESIPTIILSIP